MAKGAGEMRKTGWVMSPSGLFSCYSCADGETAGGAGLADLNINVWEGRLQRLAVKAVTYDLFPAEGEARSLKLVHTLFLKVGLQLGADGVGFFLNGLRFRLQRAELLHTVLNHAFRHRGFLLFVSVVPWDGSIIYHAHDNGN